MVKLGQMTRPSGAAHVCARPSRAPSARVMKHIVLLYKHRHLARRYGEGTASGRPRGGVKYRGSRRGHARAVVTATARSALVSVYI